MARIHCLQEVESFGTTDLANDDAFRSHSQTVADQITHRDLPLTFEIRWARF
jgi:hypothetical protein